MKTLEDAFQQPMQEFDLHTREKKKKQAGIQVDILITSLTAVGYYFI